VKTMQLVSSMTEKAHISIPELPVVTKSHDDLFLCKANRTIGERDCICGSTCLGMFVARMRYGSDNDKGFVCKEFLLPDQYRSFLEGKGCPPQRQKCLLCIRYFLNYTYIIARANADNHAATPSKTSISSIVAMQTFTNVVTPGMDSHKSIMAGASDLPLNVSPVRCTDGYKPHAMLFVDEEFAQNRIQRESRMCALSFKPVVRFCSTHYHYVPDADGGYRIVQVGIGHDDLLGGLGFHRPLSREVSARAAEDVSLN